MDFGRLMTAMATPFDHEGKIDWKQTETLINHLIDVQKTDSLVVCGTTGESPTLTDEEKLELFRFSLDVADGRCPVIAGTGSNNTDHSIHLSEAAERIGVQGLLLVAPYYNRPAQEGLYQHFRAIAESVKLPVMLYNMPGRTGINIQADTTVRLSQLENVFAVKESTDLSQVVDILNRAKTGFRVYSGDDSSALPMLAVGGHGVVSVASHLLGVEIRSMIDAYFQGETAKAAALHRKLLPKFNGLFICSNPVPLKYALSICGIPVGSVRLPLVEANEQEKAAIRALFA